VLAGGSRKTRLGEEIGGGIFSFKSPAFSSLRGSGVRGGGTTTLGVGRSGEEGFVVGFFLIGFNGDCLGMGIFREA